MKNTLLLALGFVVGMLFFGCSYYGAVRNDFYKSSTVSSPVKIPLRVGIVQPTEFMEKAFVQNAIDKNIRINVQPYLGDAIYAEMNNIFEKAVLLKISDINDQKLDLLLIPKYDYSSIETNRFFKTFTMKQDIGYTFKDYRTNEEIISLNSQDIIDYSPPIGAKVADITNKWITFWMLSPILLPIETNSIGNHAVDVLEASLSKMISNQTEQIYINKKTFSMK